MLSLVLLKTDSNHENPLNRILNRFFELKAVENKMQFESESSSRK